MNNYEKKLEKEIEIMLMVGRGVDQERKEKAISLTEKFAKELAKEMGQYIVDSV